jgi:hypothetical protein
MHIYYETVGKFMRETIERLYLEVENLTPSQIEALPSFQDALATLINQKTLYTIGKSHTSDVHNLLSYDILAVLYNPTENPIECSIKIGDEICDSYIIPPKSSVFPLRGTMIPILCLAYHRMSILSSKAHEIVHVGIQFQHFPPEGTQWPWPVRNPRRHLLTPYLVEFESEYGLYDQGMFRMIHTKEEYEQYKRTKPGWDWSSYQDWFGIHTRSRKRSQKRCELIKDELMYLSTNT